MGKYAQVKCKMSYKDKRQKWQQLSTLNVIVKYALVNAPTGTNFLMSTFKNVQRTMETTTRPIEMILSFLLHLFAPEKRIL